MKVARPLKFRFRPRELQAILLQRPTLVTTRWGTKRVPAGWWLLWDARGRPYDVYAPADFVTAFEAMDPTQARPWVEPPPVPVTVRPAEGLGRRAEVDALAAVLCKDGSRRSFSEGLASVRAFYRGMARRAIEYLAAHEALR